MTGPALRGPTIGLGCMRLSAAVPADRARTIEVVHAALDAGATLLDTADVYAPDASTIGHNERLVAEALASWRGDRAPVRIATKGGLRRTGARWVADGRAKHLRAACAASRHALGADVIDLYQLHAVDPGTPLETSVRALAALRDEGVIRAIGLCNVNVAQIEAARAIAPIAAVQVELSVFAELALRGGVATWCRDHGIELIAYRPLGGAPAARVAADAALREVASRRGATPHEIALAWLLDLDACVVPVPGATRVPTARSLARVLGLTLDHEDRAILDRRFPAGRILRIPVARRRPPDDAPGDVVVVMGMQAAGKSGVARELVAAGYERLNRDERGGRVADLVPVFDAGLAAGRVHWVLDNTYPTRAARNEVIECAWRRGVPVRCIHVTIPLADAQINAVERMLAACGHLPGPDEIRARGRTDPRFFGPDAQFRWFRQIEPPVPAEGFARIEERTFRRRPAVERTGRGLFIEYDGGVCEGSPAGPAEVRVPGARRDALRALHGEGWTLIALAWRPAIAAGRLDEAVARAGFERAREMLAVELEVLCCPHAPGPPVCWCRRPLPGLVLDAASRHSLAFDRSLIVGRPPADRTLADRLGIPFRALTGFFER